MKRSVGLVALVGAFAGVAAIGYGAGTRVQSAAEIAARTAPPPPSVITVPVERTILATEVVTRGTVQFGAPREVTLPASALKTGSRIVTSVTTAGTQVKEGDVALAVSGRPVFVLQGAQPAYRDLAPGTSGEDVRQLETALLRLGFDPGPIDGLYDGATSDAVGRWYVAAGWTPQGPTADQLSLRRTDEADARQGSLDILDGQEAVRAARATADSAIAKLRQAELAVTSAAASDSRGSLAAEAEVSRLEGLLRVANEELRSAELAYVEARDGTAAPATPSEIAVLEAEVNHSASLVAAARADVEAARTAAKEANVSAAADVAAKRRALDDALRAAPPDRFALDAARAEYATAQARYDAVVRAGQADETAKLRAVDAAVAQLDAAKARLNDANTGKIRPATPAELAARKAAVVAAQAAVTAATNDLSLARSALAAAPGGSAAAAAIDLTAARAEVASARAAVLIAERRAGLAPRQSPTSGATATTGFQVPADELLFFPTLPLRVQALAVQVGDRVEGAVMTVTNSRLLVIGAVNAADAQVIQVGSAVKIAAAELGVTAAGTVSLVARTPGTQGADAQRFAIEVTPADAPASIVGASVVLTINVSSTAGEVLAVPVSALSLAPDGSTRVQLRGATGVSTAVTVRPGLAARGLVEVTPLSGPLAAGDLVLIPSALKAATTK